MVMAYLCFRHATANNFNLYEGNIANGINDGTTLPVPLAKTQFSVTS